MIATPEQTDTNTGPVRKIPNGKAVVNGDAPAKASTNGDAAPKTNGAAATNGEAKADIETVSAKDTLRSKAGTGSERFKKTRTFRKKAADVFEPEPAATEEEATETEV